MPKLTQARALALLRYDPETGMLVRRVGHRVRTERVIVSKTASGYVELMLDGEMHYAHRVIWLMQTGAFPVGAIDHLNGVRADNRWANLRDVGLDINAQNLYRAHRDSKSGLLGVEAHHSGRYCARICTRGVKHYLGLFDTPELAHAAYLAAKSQHHPESGVLK